MEAASGAAAAASTADGSIRCDSERAVAVVDAAGPQQPVASISCRRTAALTGRNQLIRLKRSGGGGGGINRKIEQSSRSDSDFQVEINYGFE